MPKEKIALFGGGPSCLIAAFFLADYFDVSIYEQGKTIGRKFLVAGNGGFNITNNATGNELLEAYSANAHLNEALINFDTVATRNWLTEIGVTTYVGSSGRIFPDQCFKPIAVLSKLKEVLVLKNVTFQTNHEFVGFTKNNIPLVQLSNASTIEIDAVHYIFGLGGGSWKVTGANEKWHAHFKAIGVDVKAYAASNCGVRVNWPANFLTAYEGTPLKNISITVAGNTLKGEALITEYGLEGNVIYPHVPAIRQLLKDNGNAAIQIDFKPNNSLQQVLKKVANRAVKPKNYKYTFNIDKAVQAILKNALLKDEYLNAKKFADTVKQCEIEVTGLRPIEEAISTVGGIEMSEINACFNLKKHSQISIIGEMLDWDAPTGGFLLQGCFSTGYACASGLLNKFKAENQP